MLSIRKIGVLGRAYRNVNRYRQILQILIRYGFADLVDSLRVEQYLELALGTFSREPRPRLEKVTTAERVRLALEELGPTFIKLGQILSLRLDLIPLLYVQELAKLQDAVPPMAAGEVDLIFRAETGKSPEELYRSFEREPLAAASLGQVHRATLAGGRRVAVKIQRPRMRELVEVDLEIMLHLATLMERHLEELEIHRPTGIVEEFSRVMNRELNYSLEALNLERFQQLFAGSAEVYVPKVFRELTTTRLLTMEYIEGIKVSQLGRLGEEGYDLRLIARRGMNSMLTQVFEAGFFHADPHPGNLFVLPNNVLCYLDFGMMGRIHRQEREDLCDLAMHLVHGNDRKIVSAFLKIVSGERSANKPALERDLLEFVDQYLYLPLRELRLGEMLKHLVDLTTQHGLRLHPNLFLVLKTLSTVESLGLMLDPEFELLHEIEPFIRKIHLGRLHPRRVARELMDSGSDFVELLTDIPGEIRTLLTQAKEGSIKIEFVPQGLAEMLASHDMISNRISYAIVLAALIIASAVVVHSGIPPTWHGIPVIGLTGFLVAGLMGFWLLLSILRHGKL